MAARKPIIPGEQFGRLTVLGEAQPHRNGRRQATCRCSCGTITIAMVNSLKTGNTKSCGCQKIEASRETTRALNADPAVRTKMIASRRTPESRAHTSARFTTHGETRNQQVSYLYRLWTNIKGRCTNPRHPDYSLYGATGITLDAAWLNAPAAFISYVRATLGERPTPAHSLDRFPDNHGSYAPGNLRWATPSEQSFNRRKRRAGCKRQPRHPKTGE